jgi:hypothetical protein
LISIQILIARAVGVIKSHVSDRVDKQTLASQLSKASFGGRLRAALDDEL